MHSAYQAPSNTGLPLRSNSLPELWDRKDEQERSTGSQQQPSNNKTCQTEYTKECLLRELQSYTPSSSTKDIVECLSEIQMYHYSDIQNCKAVAATVRLLTVLVDEGCCLDPYAKKLVEAAISVLKGLMEDQCTELSKASYIYFGAPHEDIAEILLYFLDESTIVCDRIKRWTVLCLRYLVTRGNATHCIKIGPVLGSMLHQTRDASVGLESSELLKELLSRGLDAEEVIDEGAMRVLLRAFCTTERRKTLPLLEVILQLITLCQCGREYFIHFDRIEYVVARLLSLLTKAKNGHSRIIQVTLQLLAVAVERDADLKRVTLASKHLPSLIRLLEDCADQVTVVDNVLRVIAYVVHFNKVPALLKNVVPCVPPLLKVSSRYSSAQTGKVAASVLIELCAYSDEARTALLHRKNNLAGIISGLPASEGSTLLKVLQKAHSDPQIRKQAQELLVTR